jgi:hypothetical protein
MGFSNKELLHGAALAGLILDGNAISVRCAEDQHSDVYEVRRGDTSLLVVFKYSTKKKSPWQFSFGAQQVDALRELRLLHPSLPIVVAFVCHVDGVCALHLEELVSIGLNLESLVGAGVSVSRPRGGSYWVSGPGREKMNRSVPQNRWLNIFAGGSVDT